MHTEIEKHRGTLTALCHRYGVLRLEVFGSAARGADFDPAKSDADFLVEFDKASGLSALDQFLGFSEALERLLGRPVDLVEASAVRNPYVRATINRSKELIMKRDPRAFLWDVQQAAGRLSSSLRLLMLQAIGRIR
jgi:uncharacterized protein